MLKYKNVIIYHGFKLSHTEIEKIRQLNRELHEARQCKLCLDAEIGTVILPCGHACTCTSCIMAVTHCPICRMFIRGTVKIAFN